MDRNVRALAVSEPVNQLFVESLLCGDANVRPGRKERGEQKPVVALHHPLNSASLGGANRIRVASVPANAGRRALTRPGPTDGGSRSHTAPADPPDPEDQRPHPTDVDAAATGSSSRP